MLLRQALLAALLISGTAAVAVAQSDEFPFRRFAPRNRIMLRHDMPSFRFSIRDQERLRGTAERLRARLESRAFAMRDKAGRRQMDMHFRSMDRMQERLRNRLEHFRFERPMKVRRHSRTI